MGTHVYMYMKTYDEHVIKYVLQICVHVYAVHEHHEKHVIKYVLFRGDK